MLEELSMQFKEIVSNIMANEEIEDKAAAVTALAGEFAQRVDDAMKQKEARWQPLTDKVATKLDELKQKPMKTEGGVKFPASDFAYVPDPEKPSTWKLRLSEGSPGNVTIKQLGRAAAAFSPGGFRGQKVQIPSSDVGKVKGKIRAAYKKLGVKSAEIPASVKEQTFSVWKEAADAPMRWMAVYSNNYRDDDSPPEIISKEAHLDFVRAVDAGEWPMPELWHWHVKGSRYGVATVIAYDEDTGMSLAAGMIDKGMEPIAEAIFARNPLVSHGMPTEEIRRSQDDLTVMTRYRTKEISTLPDVAAANKITFYELNQEKESMNIPEKKLEELQEVGFDVDALAAKLTAAQQKAEDEERESKEVEIEEKDTEEVVETQAEVTEPTAPALDYDALAGAIGAALDERLEPLQQRIAALEIDDDEKEKELDLTPAASIAGVIRSAVLGQESARVDGRSTKAKDKPAENKETTKASPLLNSGNLLADTIVSDLLDPNSTWVQELPIREQ
jgi:LysM repeat protein